KRLPDAHCCSATLGSRSHTRREAQRKRARGASASWCRIHQVEELREGRDHSLPRGLRTMAVEVRGAEDEGIPLRHVRGTARVLLTDIALETRNAHRACPGLLGAVVIVSHATVRLELKLERGDLGGNLVGCIGRVVEPESGRRAVTG